MALAKRDRRSTDASPDAVHQGEQQLTFALVLGPVIQFAVPAGGGPGSSPVVALPTQMPLSCDSVFVHPAAAELPDNLSHFCFAPVLKINEPSELSFCSTYCQSSAQRQLAGTACSSH